VRRWLKVEYSAIRELARVEKAEIHSEGEMDDRWKD
jgi:hypothetical protein